MKAHVSANTAPSAVWDFACPICRSTIAVGTDAARCVRCERTYACSGGIWRFLPEERLAEYTEFLREYRIVREAQGWGKPDAAYFLALPNVASNDPQRTIWRRRSESCRLLFGRVIGPTAAELGRPLRILDVGAGNCWLANRLTIMGHTVAAIDLSADAADGLGAHVWYGPELGRRRHPPFTPIQAEFDHLPLPDHGANVVVFNASLHYSTDYEVTLREGLRVLTRDGVLVIMDSPVYRHGASGEQMVREREGELERIYGFRSNSVPAEHFLTTDRLETLARHLALRLEVHPLAGSLTRARGHWRRMRGLRELAEMPVIVAYPA